MMILKLINFCNKQKWTKRILYYFYSIFFLTNLKNIKNIQKITKEDDNG